MFKALQGMVGRGGVEPDSTPDYQPISEAALQRCVDETVEIVEEFRPDGTLSRRRTRWDEERFKELILEEAIGAAALSALDPEGRDELLARISREQFGPDAVSNRA